MRSASVMTAPVSYAPHFGEMKRYVRFSAEDVRLLHGLRDHAEPHFEQIVREFYERAREHEAAHAVFASEEQIGRLHDLLIDWLRRLLTGPYDDDYCAKSARIGAVHVRVGLPQRYMFTAMNLFRVRLHQIVTDTMAEDAASASHAVSRILDLELAVMNQAYRAAYVERHDRIREHGQPSSGSDRRYRAAIDLADAFVIGIDNDGLIRLFSRPAERLTGYRADEVIGNHFVDTFIEEDDHGFREVLAGVLASDDSSPVTLAPCCSVRTRSGRLRDLSGRLCRAEPGSDGVRVLLVCRDVTDDRAAEATRTRTEKLAAVGTLAAGLAHEIRNPLNGAQLHLTYMRRALKRRDGNPDLVEAVDVVASEVARLSALVNDFLAFARPARLRYEPAVLQDLCLRAVRLVEGQIPGAKLVTDLPQTALDVAVDAAKIEQVLLNLLTNAMDAIVEVDGGQVILRAYRRPREVVIEVRDNGGGFDATDPIFDVFFSTKPSGTGLGLAIVHRIVDDHGGRIEYSSKPGDTQFQVCLPLRAFGAFD